MCGVLGYYNMKGGLPSREVLLKLIDLMQHRGPDDSGIFISSNKKVVLASRRLSIIDLSERGHQPMSNENKTIWIVHNGEVYNFRELRRNLSEFKFKSDTDTEVILNLYEKFGVDCLQHLRGMFAFIIYDKRKEMLFFARDHLGIKPLYYYWDGNNLIIASEIRAIIAAPEVQGEIDISGFLSYLDFGSVAEPRTIIKGINSLPPASYGIFKDGKLEIKRYWKIENEKKLEKKSILKEELLEILKESVRLRLVSDVPLGAFLSGGIDSSSVVSLMKEVSDNEVKTFSITFGESNFSEGSFAGKIANKYGTTHTEKVITSGEVHREMDTIINAMDQPTIDGVNTYFVSKFAKESGITVALSGLGGDELFGGYPSFYWVPYLYRIGKNPFSRAIAKAAMSFLKNNDKKEKLRAYLNHNPSLSSAYFSVRGLLLDKYMKKILKPKFYQSIKDEFSPISYIDSLLVDEKVNAGNKTDVVSLFELRGYMNNQLLRDTDFMSMAHSLEVRVPIIDKDVVEYAFSLPSQYRKRKKFFIEVMEERLPKEIWNRPKQGFTFPFDNWIRTELKEWVKESLFSANTEYFDRDGIDKLWGGFISGEVHWSRVWVLSVFNRWKDARGLNL